MKINVHKLMTSNKTLLLACDQGLEHGPKDFNEKNIDPNYILDIALEGKYNGVILHNGIAEKYYHEHYKDIPLIIKLNGKTNLLTSDPFSKQICSVDRAIKLGASAVGYTLYPGSENESKEFAEFGKIVDEAHDMWYGFLEFNNSLQTSDDLQGWRYEDWASNYRSIRKCNVFFEKVDQGKFNDVLIDGKTLKDRLTGEAHFLRAFLYTQLVNLYGGVPIIKTTYGLTDDFKIARNTYSDCIKFIVEECDLAAGLLPLDNTGGNYGRATKGAALALKSQVLIYAASELHNNNPKFSGFANPALLGYTSGTAQERWTAAKNATKAVMDLNLYSLYKPEPATGAEATQNFIDLFIADRTTEDIYVKFFIPKEGGNSFWDDNYGNNLALVSGPNGFHLWGQNAPSGNAVDAYEMTDGSKFSWNNPAHAALPYANRDPRFYSSVLYEGVKWRSRPQDVAAMDLVLYLTKNLADFVLNSVRPAGFLLEAVEVWEKLLINESQQVITGQGLVMVNLAVFILWRCPRIPAVLLIENVRVFLPVELGLHNLIVFQRIKVFQEEQPGSLLRIIQFTRTTSILPEDIIDILKSLFKHCAPLIVEPWLFG